MQEDFIHYLWKFKKLSGCLLHTTTGEPIIIKSLGTHNHHSGPDFFNARLQIGKQEWAGNVEMHVRASDWYKHAHDDDPAYDNVILHVVWKHDAEISRRDEVNIPVLEVSQYVSIDLLDSYKNLFVEKNNKFINCDSQLSEIDTHKKSIWFEKLFIERLEDRADKILMLLDKNQNDWEAMFFTLLGRSFGTKVNADALENITQSIPQQTLRKLARDAFQLEAALFGQSGLLINSHNDLYYRDLLTEYEFLKVKYNLIPAQIPLKFFRLRPANFPTIRLSQLAMIYNKNPQLFAEVLLADSMTDLYALFEVSASKYWEKHHVFAKETSVRKKKTTKDFIDLIIINCVLPVKFAYSKHTGKDNFESLLKIIYALPAESNTIVAGFKNHIDIESALESQAVLQLKPKYCDKNRCLSCDYGVSLLRSN